MADITLTVDEMYDLTNELNYISQEVATDVNEVSRVVSNIEQGWTGTNSQAFADKLLTFQKTKLSHITESIDDIANTLHLSADRISETQDGVKMMITGLGGASSVLGTARNYDNPVDSNGYPHSYNEEKYKTPEYDNPVDSNGYPHSYDEEKYKTPEYDNPVDSNGYPHSYDTNKYQASVTSNPLDSNGYPHSYDTERYQASSASSNESISYNINNETGKVDVTDKFGTTFSFDTKSTENLEGIKTEHNGTAYYNDNGNLVFEENDYGIFSAADANKRYGTSIEMGGKSVLGTSEIDLNNISTSANGALNGDFVDSSKLTQSVWNDTENLSLNKRNDGTYEVLHDGVVVGFTTDKSN